MLRKPGIISFVCIAFLASSFVITQSEVEEYAAKAAFIYNFTKFVEWEDNAMNNASTFNIGVLGDSPILKPLQDLSVNKRINNKKINIVKYASISDVKSCHILFIPETTSSEIIKESIESSSIKSTLIISEKSGELENGSAINFLLVNSKIKFEINLNSLSKNNIKASSQLLKLATNIKN